MKNILVATDFSENAKCALNVALKIANEQKATLHLFHSFQIQNYYANMPMSFMGDMTEQLRSEADKEMRNLEKLVPVSIRLKTYIGDNVLVTELKDYVKKENIDMIVVGAGGSSKLHYSLLGSTANQIIENCSCLVLTIPPGYEFKNFSKMIYASDLQGEEFIPLVKFAEFAKLFDVDLTVLHIKTDGDKNENEISKLISKVRLQTDYPKVHVQQEAYTDALEGISKYIAESHTEIFAMAIHERSFFEKLVHVSLTKKMAHISKVPLLVFRKEKITKKAGIFINSIF